MSTSAPVSRDETDLQRAENYEVLAMLLQSAPTAEVLAALSVLPVAGDSALERAWGDLARAAAETPPEAAEKEFFDLFIGVGRGELLPYASFYITGFLNERPLADLRGDLAALGIARRAGDHDPEDRMAMLCAVMASYASGALVPGQGALSEGAFFARHLAPWGALFFEDLEKAPAARFYACVGRVGRLFFDIEQQAFALSAQDPAAA